VAGAGIGGKDQAVEDHVGRTGESAAPTAPGLVPLALVWERFAERECRGYSLLYERISRSVAADPDLLGLIELGSPSARQPNLLLAAVHYLLLSGLEHPLGELYAGRSSTDPAPLFHDFCFTYHDEVLAVLSTRHTQTNECGRSAAIVPALRWVSEQLSAPLALVDVGASAGLNLLCDQVRIDYGPAGATGPLDSPVRIDSRVLGGTPPIHPLAPTLAGRVGLDREPIDLDDPDATRWLLACVWPDTGRLDRTVAAIGLARRARPVVVRGDAVTELANLLDDLPDHATPCVTTTWTVAYFGTERTSEFIAELARAGRHRPLAWISAEFPGAVKLLTLDTPPEHDLTTPSVLGAVIFDRAGPHPTTLGWVQPHGRWIDWRA
jgi:hypothetical protein